MLTVAETIKHTEDFLAAIVENDLDQQGGLTHFFTIAVADGDIPNADAAALIDLACEEEEDAIAISHLEQALEILRDGGITE